MKLDIVKNKIWFLCLSAILLAPGIGAMIYSSITYPTHTPLKVGIDYTGGTTLQYGVNTAAPNEKIGELREKLAANGVDNPYLQVINVSADNQKEGLKSIISIRTKFIEEGSDVTDKITKVMNEEYNSADLLQVSSVGATLGSELFKNAVIALSLAILGIIFYLTMRFQFDYALAAILGLVHDVLFILGVFSIMGLVWDVQIDGLFITALLTVIGFSVHDTIVVFDRVRENLKYYSKKMSFGEIVNFSIHQTLARSINTSLTTVLTLLALYLFGGVTTRDFVLAMMLGIIIGTYSSIFFCASLVDMWREGSKKRQAA